MPSATYPDYKLSIVVFEAWLRHTFQDANIVVENANGYFVWDFQEGYALTDGDKKEIKKLKGVMKWKCPTQTCYYCV